MASGVEVTEECIQAWEDIKFKKHISYVSFKISDDKKSIVVEEVVTKTDDTKGEQGYKKFVEQLDPKKPRYYVYSFCYTLPDGGDRDKLVFIPWIPDTLKIKEKMIYASSKDALKKKLGVPHEVQATDKDECAYEIAYDKVSRGGTQ